MSLERTTMFVVSLLLASCGTGDPASEPRERMTSDDGGAGGSRSGAGAGGAIDFGQGGAGGSTPPGASPTGGGAATLPALNADSVLGGSCATATVESALLPTHVLFVLDRSGSMLCNPPPTTGSESCEQNPTRADAAMPSKWEIVEGAMIEALRALPQDVGVGVSYFSNDDACGVHPTPSVAIKPLSPAQLTVIEGSLAAVTPGGGTPIVGATILAYQHLHALALDGQLAGNKFVVMLTDGQQSEQCGAQDRCATAAECTELLVGSEAPKASGPGAAIRTFVIGAPGSEPARSMLSRLAVAGGTAPEGCDADAGECHFDMATETDFAGALSTALVEITGRAATCELPLPTLPTTEEPLDRALLNVVYSPGDGSDPKVLAQDTRSACDAGADGWQYAEDGSTIRLCGPTCNTVRNDRGSRVDVVLGCPVKAPE
jgi:hypothetical protein